MVEQRAAHQLHRLLGAVAGDDIVASFAAKPIQVCHLPKRRLFPVAAPSGRLPLANGVPARFMLPVIVAAAQRKVLLGPDDLAADFKAGAFQRLRDGDRVDPGMPDVGDIARKQIVGRRPVDALIVEHFAGLARRLTRPASRHIGSYETP